MTTGLVIGIIVVVLILILLISYISISNNLNRTAVKIDEAASGIDVALTKRYDVLTKQLDIVKGYAKHEAETLENVVSLRKGMPVSEKSDAANKMNDLQNKINIIAENYPELKASENFKTLQLTVNDTEEHLQASRRAYNANVSKFNQLLVTFPSSIVANMKHLTKKDFFEAEEIKRNDVKMEF